jgi:DegV family protein with EDD domain
MPRVRVVTDSGCDIPAALLQRLGISLVPFTIHIGDRIYRDRVNMTPDQFFRRLATSRQAVTVEPPSSLDFYSTYTNLSRATNAVVSIHTSSKLCGAHASAVAAKDMLSGNTRVILIDSLSASMGLGFIVLAAAAAAQRGETLDDVVALVRGMILQTHLMVALETTAYLERSDRLGKVSTLLSDMVDARPLLQLEEGAFEVAEKVRTKAKVTERLYEFVELFPRIQDLAVLYSTSPADADTLVKRVDAVFPKEQVVAAQCGPALGIFLGPGTIGVAAHEGKG